MAANKELQIENIGNSYMGTVYLTPLYGSYANQKIEAFEIQDMSIRCVKTIIKRRTLNSTSYQTKCVNKEYQISGSMFACSTIFIKIESEFDENNIQPMYNMDFTNNWEGDGLGKQRFKLDKVVFSDYDVAKLAVASDDVPISISGTAKTCKVMEEAVRPDVEWTE